MAECEFYEVETKRIHSREIREDRQQARIVARMHVVLARLARHLLGRLFGILPRHLGLLLPA